MATNPPFEISSSSPDNAAFAYPNSHRSRYSTRSHYSTRSAGPNLERASSFRESHEGGGRAGMPGGAGPSFGGAGSTLSHGDLPPLSQVLALDLIATGEQKYAKQSELKKVTAAALVSNGAEVPAGVQLKPLEQQGPEELKRIRASLIENAARARERSRTLAEAITKLDKYRASIQSRKRACAEAHAHERLLISVSREHPVPSNATSAQALSNKANFCVSPSHASVGEGGMLS